MSHLNHQVCGVDFYISYNPISREASDLVAFLQTFFSNNYLTHFSNDSIQFNTDYMLTLRMQSLRSKCFLFVIDTFSLECEYFLYTLLHAQIHKSKFHLPVLIGVVLDDQLSRSATHTSNADDRASKRALLSHLTEDETERGGVFIVNMSHLGGSREQLVAYMRDILIDFIPIPNSDEPFALASRMRADESRVVIEKKLRYADNHRPIIQCEHELLLDIERQQVNLMKKFQVSNVHMSKSLQLINVSVPHEALGCLVKTMFYRQCHLIWIDCIKIKHVNYFQLVWAPNQASKHGNRAHTFASRPPRHLVFFDLNSAQLANLHKEYCVERGWSVSLLDSYTLGSEMHFICQLQTEHSNDQQQKRVAVSESLGIGASRMEHGLVDGRFDKLFSTLRFESAWTVDSDESYGQCYLPIRVVPVLLDGVDRHLYYSTRFKSVLIDRHLCAVARAQLERTRHRRDRLDRVELLSAYVFRKDLSDAEMLATFEHYAALGWKLLDLKAYMDEQLIGKFAIIMTAIVGLADEHAYYEGTYKLLVGLSRDELTVKMRELEKKQLYPRIVTNHGYSNRSDEHLYTVFFCQF